MNFIKNGLIVFVLALILAFFLVSLLVGCATYDPNQVKLPSNTKLPAGYSLVLDGEQIRVRLPDGYLTEAQWVTVEIAIEYAISYEEWNKSH